MQRYMICKGQVLLLGLYASTLLHAWPKFSMLLWSTCTVAPAALLCFMILLHLPFSSQMLSVHFFFFWPWSCLVVDSVLNGDCLDYPPSGCPFPIHIHILYETCRCCEWWSCTLRHGWSDFVTVIPFISWCLQWSQSIPLYCFQNVILQMISVYPDLLSDQAPPPVSPALFEALPTISIDQSHLGQFPLYLLQLLQTLDPCKVWTFLYFFHSVDSDNSCPICLCNFEMDEEAKLLQCQHYFHTLCIQAWLKKVTSHSYLVLDQILFLVVFFKLCAVYHSFAMYCLYFQSGTCPVCRHVLANSGATS